jgi:signal peptidase I
MRGWLKGLTWVATIVGGALIALYVTAFDVWTVPIDDPLLAASVQPTLMAGDLVVVTRHASVDRANLLRCPDPQAAGRYVVARAIGGPREEIEIQSEIVTLDGHRLPSPRACDQTAWVVFDPNANQDVTLACAEEDYGEMPFSALRSIDHPEPPTKARVETGRWFLVSDDRHVHLDSRDYGQIDVANCQHVVFRLLGAKGMSDARSRLNIIW